MNIKINGTIHYIDPGQMEEQSLLEWLIDQGYSIPHPCMGGGKCGKCKVKVNHPIDQPVTAEEDKLLSDEEQAENHRLACRLKLTNSMSVELLDTKPQAHPILNSGFLPDIRLQPNVKAKTFELNWSKSSVIKSWAEAIKKRLPAMDLKLYALASFKPEESHHTAICIGQEVVSFIYPKNKLSLYGLAIDIGTTTIVLTLVDLLTGNIVKTMSDINPQTTHGLDVLSRITYVMVNESNGLQKLQKLVVKSINQMIKTICIEMKIDKDSIYEVTVAANPTMTHLLLGLSPNTLGKAPFIPMINESQRLKASQLGIKGVHQEASLTTLPLVSAYVGSDIVAGALIAQYKSKNTFLLIDIGTNGEIVLQHKGQLVSCSCAAGPAMEGMNISSGMKASTGAIEDVHISQEGIQLAVIGDSEPKGLCGSGVLATMREALAMGLVNKRGRIVHPDDLDQPYLKKLIGVNENGKRWINLTKQIKFTQADVRQIQLAKGSILAAIYTLLEAREVGVDQVDQVIVAGQFGAHVKEESLIGVDIVPREFSGKIEYIGNSSHSGAYLSLISTEVRQDLIDLAQSLDYIELSLSNAYERRFAKCAQFKV